jgi:molybdate-binding protein
VPENPKHIASIRDLTRTEIEITNREAGAGCRYLLDDLLKKNCIPSAKVKGYDRMTPGQRPPARLVKSGEVDCCINTQAAATSLGLRSSPGREALPSGDPPCEPETARG